VRSATLALLGLLALLLAPTAAAVSALEDAPRLGPREARLIVRAEGEIAIAADLPITWTVVALDSWHGLAGAIELVLRRDADEARVVDVTDGSGAGLTLEWPPSGRGAPAVGAMPLALVLALAAWSRERLKERRVR